MGTHDDHNMDETDWERVVLGSPDDDFHDATELDSGLPADADAAETSEVEELTYAEDTRSRRRPARWAMWRRGRALWITVGIAVLSLVLGLVVGRFAISPADAAASAKPPAAGPVTVAVTSEELRSTVTARGDVGFANATEVKLGASEEPQVVTGSVPALGDKLTTLSIALEVAGRPLIVLPGDLPAYRDMKLGMSGPDVKQLKAAMVAAGIGVGDPNSNVFDAATASAVQALYQKVGYAAPTPPGQEGGDEDPVTAAQQAYEDAADALTSAEKALAAAGGTKASEVQTADNAVSSAKRAFDAARAAVDQAAAATPADPVALAQAKATLGDAEDALKLAQTQRTEAGAAKDTSAEADAVASAKKTLSRAGESLKKAKEKALPGLPMNEVLFLGGLPRQVSSVTAVRGTPLSTEEAAMTVSSAVLQVTASVGKTDAERVKQGGVAVFIGDDGKEHNAKVAAVSAPDADSGDISITLTPDPLTPEEVTLLEGQNVRVSLPIESTNGKVLAVPLAAVITGADGGSKVEVVEGDPSKADAKTRTVRVTTGLAAGDLIEVRPTKEKLKAGDLVVVGK